ncbi:MAG TPA: hypothetical protein VIK52_07150 [Opitutaceae bacterium]
MKTFTSLFTLVATIAGVVVPGFMAAGVTLSNLPVLLIGLAITAAFAVALNAAASVDQVRTGSSTATNYFTANPAPVAKTVRTTRRVRAIIEIAA